MGEILFLFITQPEEICEAKKFFEWILLFPDGFPDCTIFISMATFPIAPETIMFLCPSSKTKESLKY